ncbi:MAG: MFS transporter [Oscillospiraceae bacterium]|jgi:DHA3 family macrolide efflux protein-like MFS transporter|nr:MFS transporter [Oscillospiraceae bacterium]
MKNWKRNASFFIIAEFISMFGSMLVQHAITWHITLQTKSGLIMTLFTCAALLPMVLISPLAGVWADRYNRKSLIIISDASIALVTLLLIIAYFLGWGSIGLLLVAVVVRSFGQGIQQPAVSAIIPQIVPQESLARFNGIQGSVQSFTMFAAPMAGGVLLSFLPIEYIFIIDVATAAVGIAVVLLFVNVTALAEVQKAAAGLRAYLHELREGLSYINKTKWLKLLVIYGAFFSFFISPAAMLTPLQVARSFGSDVWRLTAIEVAFSVGMMAGGVIISIWGGFKNKTYTMIAACFACGVTTILFGVIPNFWVYMGVMLFCGITVPFFNTPAMTIMQTKIEPQLMGRVFSVDNMLSSLAMPLAMALFGPLGDTLSIELLLIVTGVIVFASGFVLLGLKPLIAAGKAEAPKLPQEG